MKRIVLLVVLSSAFFAMVLASAAVAAPEAYFTTQITSNSRNDGAPEVSGDRLVWTHWDGTDWELYTWTPETGSAQITSNTRDDNEPRISGDRIVWSRSEVDDPELYMWTPKDGTVRLTSNSYSDVWPDVSGDRVVWCAAAREHTLDVFTWTPTGGIVQITSGVYCDGWPRVSGDRIVWKETSEAGVDPQPGIYTWTPSGGIERITSSAGDQSPEVSGDRIVWFSYAETAGPKVFTWTPDGGVAQITTGDYKGEFPRVSGDRVAWHERLDPDGDDYDVFTWTPGGGDPLKISSNVPDAAFPRVSADRIVWSGYDGGDYEVYAWTPAAGTHRLTSNSRNDGSPAVAGNRVVWAGSDGTDYEIFSAVAYPVTVPTITSVSPTSGLTSGGTSVVITGSGFLGMSGASAVKFGGVSAASYRVGSPTSITAVAPANAAGKVDIVVTAAGGSSDAGEQADDFTYLARYQQSDARLAYRGLWTTSTVSAASGGSFRFTDSPGASVTVVFQGTYFAWIAKQSPLYGEARVTVDGRSEESTHVDLGSISTVYRAKVYELNVPAGGVHTVLIECTGSKNPNATGANISVDAFDIAGTLLQAPIINRYQQSDARLAYAGRWTVSSTALASGGSFRFANSPGASVTIPFSGTSLSWLAKKSPLYGVAQVTVDGTAVSTVDLYDANTRYRQIVWDTGKLADGLHTVRIEWTGDGNEAAAGTNISVDAFDVLGRLASATRAEQTDSHILWAPSASSWTTSRVTAASGGSFRFANSSGAKTTITFTGVKLDILTKKSPVYGIARIRLDDGAAVLVDLYSSATVYKQQAWSTGFLPPGDHTVTIEWTGKKRPAATGTYVNLDAVNVIGTLR